MTALMLLLGVAAMVGGVALMIWATPYRARPWSDRTTSRLAWTAFAWTVLAGVVLLLAPTSSTVSASSASTTSPANRPTEVITTTSTETLLQHEGVGVIALLSVPVAVTLVGAAGHGSAARRRRIGTGSVLAVACVLGSMSLGLYYLPATVALLTAGFKTRRDTSGPQATSPAGPPLNPAG